MTTPTNQSAAATTDSPRKSDRRELYGMGACVEWMKMVLAVAVLGAGVLLCHRANAAIVIGDDLSEDLLPGMPGIWLFGEASSWMPTGPALG